MEKAQEAAKKAKTRKAVSGEKPSESGSAEGQAPPARKKQYEIDIFRAWCKSCGICASFCPRECIGINDEGAPFAADASRCTGCGWCELHCPDFAISVREKDSPPPTQ